MTGSLVFVSIMIDKSTNLSASARPPKPTFACAMRTLRTVSAQALEVVRYDPLITGGVKTIRDCPRLQEFR